jgi:5-methylcytosine-specific restriction endonuclease McrA
MTKLYKRKSGPGRSFNGRLELDRLKKSEEWKAYRLRFLKENPKCYSCGVTATVVDHVTPYQGDEVLFKKLDNHIPLCEICHNKVTGLFDKRFVRGGSIEPKLRWLYANRKRINLTFSVKVLPYFGHERGSSRG